LPAKTFNCERSQENIFLCAAPQTPKFKKAQTSGNSGDRQISPGSRIGATSKQTRQTAKNKEDSAHPMAKLKKPRA
jgi:hypothetical protein